MQQVVQQGAASRITCEVKQEVRKMRSRSIHPRSFSRCAT